MSTIKDVAALAGVSYTTVSHVINKTRPVSEKVRSEVEAAIRVVPGVEDVRVNLVWTPPWGPERMSEEARLELGML